MHYYVGMLQFACVCITVKWLHISVTGCTTHTCSLDKAMQLGGLEEGGEGGLKQRNWP